MYLANGITETNLCTSSDSQRAIISSGVRPESSMARLMVPPEAPSTCRIRCRFGQRLDDARLVSDAHAAAGQDEGTASEKVTSGSSSVSGVVFAVAASLM